MNESFEATAKEQTAGKTKKARRKNKAEHTLNRQKMTKSERKNKQKEKREERKNSVPFFRGIQFKMVSAFLVPVLFIIFLGVTSFQNASASVVSSYENSVNQTMQMMEQYLSLVIDTVQLNYKEYINDDSLLQYYKGLYDTDYMKHEAVMNEYQKTMNKLITTDDMVSNIYFLSDTQPVLTTGKCQGDKLYTEYLSTNEGELVKGDKYNFFLFGNQSAADEKLGTDSSKYGARLVRYLNGAPTLMVVDISKNSIEDTLSSLDGGEGSIVSLVTQDGSEYVKKDGETSSTVVFNGTEFYERANQSEETEGAEYVKYEEEDYLFLYAKVEGRGAMICTLIPKANIVAQVSGIKRLTILLVAIASLVAIIMGSLMAGSYGRTINKIVHNLKKVGKGDLTVSITTKRKDEFKLLAEGITDMVTSMKDLITNVTDASAELAEAATQVAESTGTFIQTSDGIKNAISEIETGTSKLDTDSADCLEQMDSLSQKIGFVSESAAEISVLTDSTGEAITAGINSMEELNRSTASTTEVTSHVILAIQELEEKSRSIGKIINTINEIAEETNLLSLNASIEAARAGEAGRGFAVVAEEIKKLADQSMGSASEIEHIVEEIIAGTGDVVTAAKKAEEIVKSQEDAVNYTTGSFEKIDQKVDSLMVSLTQINQNVENMEHSRAASLAAIESISSISAQTAAGSTTVYSAAETQMDAVTELENASNKLAAQAEELTTMLQRFAI